MTRPAARPSRDDGQITIMAVILVAGLSLLLGLVADGGAKLQALARADTIAAEAARAALTAVDARGPTTVLDAPSAIRFGHAYLTTSGHTGTVHVTGPRTVQVTVEVTGPYPLGVFGGTYRATGTAVGELGVGVRTGGP